MPPRDPWGHKLRRCIHCGQIGPRVVVLGGYAHRRCIPKPIQAIKSRKATMVRAFGFQRIPPLTIA